MYGEGRSFDSSEYNFDRFSGKDLDDELEQEDGLSNSEEIAADLRQLHGDIQRKLPVELNDTIADIIETIAIHYDSNSDEWVELRNKIDDLMQKMDLADSSEIDDKIDEEFEPELSELEKTCISLAKKKVH